MLELRFETLGDRLVPLTTMHEVPCPGSDPGDRPVRVVLVEDDDNLREALREMLTDLGLAVLGEGIDGLDGVRLATELAPDVVLMDVRMPRMDGIEASSRITKLRPNVKVVLLTAYEDPGFQEAARVAGAARYLLKGSRPNEILSAVLSAVAELPRRDVGTERTS